MSRQSKYIHHIKNSEDLDFILETYDINIDDRDKIEDLDKFIRELQIEGLYSKELEDFINRYCMFDND